MNDLTLLPALAGGALIGGAASLFLLTHGKVAGISGIYAGALRPGAADRGLRWSFLAGLLAAGVVVRLVAPSAFDTAGAPSLPLALIAGILVGIGTQLGNGCTSGHGVCGISRSSVRSLAATGAFMTTGIVTVYVMRHLLGGAQ